jgi:hypothetical protein
MTKKSAGLKYKQNEQDQPNNKEFQDVKNFIDQVTIRAAVGHTTLGSTKSSGSVARVFGIWWLHPEYITTISSVSHTNTASY